MAGHVIAASPADRGRNLLVLNPIFPGKIKRGRKLLRLSGPGPGVSGCAVCRVQLAVPDKQGASGQSTSPSDMTLALL